MKKINFDSRRLIVYAVLLVLFFLLMGLSTKFSDLNQLNDQNELMSTEVAALRSTNYILVTQIAFATSEAAVEAYAREDGYMVRPGEVLIVPISPKHITPTPELLPTVTVEPLSNLEIWFQLFFSDGNP